MHSPQSDSPPREFLRRIFTVFGLRVFPSLASLAVIVLFSRSLSTQQYGQYQNFWVQLYLLSSLGTLGLGSLIFNYPPSELRRFFSRLPLRFWGAVLGLLLLLTGMFSWLQASAMGGTLPALFFLVYSLGLWGELVLHGLRRFGLLAGINLVYALVFYAVHDYWLGEGRSVDLLFEYLILVLSLRLFILAGAILPGLKKVPMGRESVPAREKRTLWIHLGLYELSQLLFRWMDKFLISLFLIQQQAAIYFNGAQGIPFLPLWLGAVASASLMQMAQHRGQAQELIKINHQASRILASFVFPLWAFLLFYSPTLFDLILSPRYRESIPIFYVGLALVPLRAYSFTALLQHHHQGRLINLGSLGDLLLALLLAYPLYWMAGLAGVAAAFVISTFWQNGFYLYHTARIMQTSPWQLIPWRDWIRKAGLSLCLLALTFWLSSRASSELSWPWAAMILTALLALGFYLQQRGKAVS